jgi:hypothetical protein
MTLNYTLDSLSSVLEDILGPETTALITKINAQPGTSGSPFVHLPDGRSGASDPDSIRRLVALTSNEYANACRLAGLARAQTKIATAVYKAKFRNSMGPGKNEADRERPAYTATRDEYNKMVLWETIVELCESIESAGRIASESARRMMLGADQAMKADARYAMSSDSLQDNDFSTF